MSVDIHAMVEVKDGSEWVAVPQDKIQEIRLLNRRRELFDEMHDQRRELDADLQSKLLRYLGEDDAGFWGFGYLTKHDILKMLDSGNHFTFDAPGVLRDFQEDLQKLDIDDCRIIFCFDN